MSFGDADAHLASLLHQVCQPLARLFQECSKMGGARWEAQHSNQFVCFAFAPPWAVLMSTSVAASSISSFEIAYKVNLQCSLIITSTGFHSRRVAHPLAGHM